MHGSRRFFERGNLFRLLIELHQQVTDLRTLVRQVHVLLRDLLFVDTTEFIMFAAQVQQDRGLHSLADFSDCISARFRQGRDQTRGLLPFPFLEKPLNLLFETLGVDPRRHVEVDALSYSPILGQDLS